MTTRGPLGLAFGRVLVVVIAACGALACGSGDRRSRRHDAAGASGAAGSAGQNVSAAGAAGVDESAQAGTGGSEPSTSLAGMAGAVEPRAGEAGQGAEAGASTGGAMAGGGGSPPVAGRSGQAESGGGNQQAGAAGEAGITTAPLPEFTDLPACAAPLDRSVPTSMYAMARCLFEGEDAPQQRVAEGALEPRRIAVLRGRVLDEAGEPMSGVAVSLASHPEFGDTLTRADGNFDLAVNGGGELIVHYERTGYLPVQRRLATEWGRFAHFPDVVLLELPQDVTAVDLESTETTVAEGQVESDRDGTRQQIVLFAPGTQASMVMPNGETQPLSAMNVRIREFTVGSRGPLAMPAALPPNVAYTYAVSYTVDQAREAGATAVVFDPPVVSYVENFLRFPTGAAVPSGVYDPQSDTWRAAESGVVLEILDVEDDVATVDTDGDGEADSEESLQAYGITDQELHALGTRYQPGQTLWRTRNSHFSDWDSNWNLFPPLDAISPAAALAALNALGMLGGESKACGSIIGCENQTLGESLRLSGTPFRLHYQSERTLGRKDTRQVSIQLVGPSIPASVKRIDLEFNVAGRVTRRSYAPAPNLTDTYEWDQKDVYGRVVQGTQPIVARIGYAYDVSYERNTQFGYSGDGIEITSDNARSELILWAEFTGYVSNPTAEGLGLGGWGLDALHTYDAVNRTLYLGDGRARAAAALSDQITTVAGPGTTGVPERGDGGPATEALLEPYRSSGGLVCAPDGSLLISDAGRVRKMAPDGIISTYAGGGGVRAPGFDGGSAADADFGHITGLALTRDGTLYVSDASRVHAVSPDGMLRVVAGNGERETTGDGGPARDASVAVDGIAADSDGTLYILGAPGVIRRIGTDGIITRFAGIGSCGTLSGEGGPARDACIGAPSSITVGPTGEVFFASKFNASRFGILRVDSRGILRSVVSSEQLGTGYPDALAVASDGSIYAAGATGGGGYSVHRVEVDGQVSSVVPMNANAVTLNDLGDNGPAALARFGSKPSRACVGPDRSLYLYDTEWARVRRISPALPGFPRETTAIPSEDGKEVYVFDREGRHLWTVDALTRAKLRTFGYDEQGRLTSIADPFGNTTTIARDSAGQLESITGPYGETTEFVLDAKGYLASATNANGETTSYTHGSAGLLLAVTGPRLASDVHSFEYDAVGRLVRDTEPSGFFQELVRTDGDDDTFNVTLSTRMGRTSLHEVSDPDESTMERKLTSSAGVVQSLSMGQGTVVYTTPTRTTTTLQGGDPRFGMQSPILASRTIALAGTDSPAYTEAQSRTVTLATLGDPLSVTTLEEVRTINGRDWTESWDGTARTLTTTSPEGRQTVSTFDGLGQLLSVQSAGLTPAEFSYDAHGRMTGISAGDRTTTLEYGSDGRVSALVNALGERTSVARDPVGRPVLTTLPDDEQIAAGFDANDNLLSLTPPDKPAHAFTYAPGNLLDEYAPPKLGDTTDYSTYYTYNNDEQLSSTSLPGGGAIVPTYAQDSGQLVKLDVDGVPSTFSYDATTGLFASMAGGGETIAYAYTGDIPTGSTWSGVFSGTVAETLDADFRVTSQTAGGVGVDFAYDDDGLVVAAGNETVARDPASGFVTGTAIGTLSDAITHNDFGEPETYTASAGADPIYSVSFTRDGLGRIAARTETVLGETHTDEYTYDERGRLTSVVRNGTDVGSYGYDANDNRTSVTDSNGTRTPTYDSQDRLLTDGAATYAYTDAGSLLSKTVGDETTAYEYTALGGLRGVTLPAGTDIEYVLDATHRRIGKRVNGTLTQGFLYGNALPSVAALGRAEGFPYRTYVPVLAELDGVGAVVSRFVYASQPFVPDYMIRGGTTYQLISDERGSVRLVVDVATGDIAQRIEYDAWGVVTADTNPGFQPFGFAGGLHDENTGLVRFGARDYDPSVGRWTAKDPIGFYGGQGNLFEYAFSDPLNFLDLDGASPLMADTAAGAIGGAIIGAGIDLGSQLATNGGNWDCVDWGDVGTSALVGGVTGGLATFGVLGGEISIGKNFRLAPFGNRAGHPIGRWPHYHRRPNMARPPSGQGIGRHRPWQRSPFDTGWWDRF